MQDERGLLNQLVAKLASNRGPLDLVAPALVTAPAIADHHVTLHISSLDIPKAVVWTSRMTI